ncbi:LAQU0S02e01816g1_1 [Lachancea quebecensis]|uniref:Inositol-pentakisphosphate 2-kinase n=1 Tax=Lachancea quebecensis TaxID=1654605 RepID=A0A0P1KNA1_9SACH|nr:LAQU0S02e01816g1_1 [Lachancea quebecensis]
MVTTKSAVSAQLVYSGNANIVVQLPDADYLVRCCVRFDSIDKNNKYTLENIEYIKDQVRPLLGGCLVSLEPEFLKTDDLLLILRNFVPNCDTDEVIALKMEDLTRDTDETIKVDHFTKIHSTKDHHTIVWEFKPKWLCSSGSDPSLCRNCTHNKLKKRDIPYCYAMAIKDPAKVVSRCFSGQNVPERFLRDLRVYLGSEGSILVKLAAVQKRLALEAPQLNRLTSESDVTADLALLMALRDVSCFIRWEANGAISAKIVDVDLKPNSKWRHWATEQSKVDAHCEPVHH